MTEAQGHIHSYRFGHFDGPLDLLLFLVRKNEVNIQDIPIAQITEQYLEYLKYTTSIDLEALSEFYLMASTLLYIKSRMLLPLEVDIDEELDDPRKDLVDKLIEYERIKKLANLMDERQTSSDIVPIRRKMQAKLPFPDEEQLWEKIETWDLLISFSQVMKGLESPGVISLWEEVSINEKITLIMEFIEDRQEFMFDELIVNPGSVMEMVSAFLAILEMVKNRNIEVFQNRLFGDIRIKKRNVNG